MKPDNTLKPGSEDKLANSEIFVKPKQTTRKELERELTNNQKKSKEINFDDLIAEIMTPQKMTPIKKKKHVAAKAKKPSVFRERRRTFTWSSDDPIPTNITSPASCYNIPLCCQKPK